MRKTKDREGYSVREKNEKEAAKEKENEREGATVREKKGHERGEERPVESFDQFLALLSQIRS